MGDSITGHERQLPELIQLFAEDRMRHSVMQKVCYLLRFILTLYLPAEFEAGYVMLRESSGGTGVVLRKSELPVTQ